jgi:hypothetical protein
MFDTTAEIELAMRLESGAKSVLVRWPTDEEWAERSRKRKIIIQRLGRGVTETKPPEPGDADLALYGKIALNGTPPLTKGEAFQVAETLSACTVTNVEIEGDDATVDLTVLTGPVKHRLKVPTADQVVAFRRSGFRILDQPFNRQEITLFLDPGGKLWDACGGKSEDYQGPVPIIHKDTAIRAVIDFIERNLGPQNGDASF